MAYYWLSFCDPVKPAGSQFLGVSIVEADDPRSAIDAAYAQGCNPGGEVMMSRLAPHTFVPDDYVGRLMNQATIDELQRRVTN